MAMPTLNLPAGPPRLRRLPGETAPIVGRSSLAVPRLYGHPGDRPHARCSSGRSTECTLRYRVSLRHRPDEGKPAGEESSVLPVRVVSVLRHGMPGRGGDGNRRPDGRGPRHLPPVDIGIATAFCSARGSRMSSAPSNMLGIGQATAKWCRDDEAHDGNRYEIPPPVNHLFACICGLTSLFRLIDGEAWSFGRDVYVRA